MLCPYCSHPLQQSTVTTKSDQQGIIHECFNCGSHWFPRWLANDITITEAKNVDAVLPQVTPTPPDQPRCPVCQNRLSLISHDPVPRGIMVWTCPQGHGNFFPKGQLLQFKKAQEAKITYHTLWGIPIKSIFSVLLPVIAVLAIAGGIPVTLRELARQQETRTRASSLTSTPVVTPLSLSSVLISFTTTSPRLATLTLYQNDQRLYDKPISSQPASTHQITLTDLDAAFFYSFTLTLIDQQNNQSTTTQKYPIVLTPPNGQPN